MPSYVRSGAPIGVGQTASSQSKSSITALADGGFVVTWQTMDNSADGSWWAIKSQRYNAQGVAVGAETLVNNLGAGYQTAAQTASLANGGYVVTWQTDDSTQDGSGTAIKARLFDSAGVAVGAEFRVNSQTFQDQKDPTVTGLAGGGFVVAWYTTDSSQDGAGWAIKAQRYDAAGLAVGTEFRVNTTAFGSQWKADVTGLTNGGFVVTWQTGNDMNSEVYAQIYGADGVKVGGQFVANGSIMYDTLGKVAALPGGGFVVTWMTYDADSLGIRAQIFSATGAKVGTDFAVNSASAGTQIDPDIAVLADGTFLITWEEQYGGIKSQAFTASGQRIGGENLIFNDSGTESQATVAALAGGRFVVSYTYNGGTASGDDIRLQMLQPNTAPDLGAETRAYSMFENLQTVGTITASDSDGPSPLSYSIFGGPDAARFSIVASTGVFSFRSSPDFENPSDSNGDNVYQFVVRVTDGELEDFQTISVTVQNQGDAPIITSNGGGATASISIRENIALATTVTASDQDSTQLTYSITGGTDAAKFSINAATGALTFVSTPNFEQPGDSNGDNVYLVNVRVSDGGWLDFQNLTITVTNANERPVIVSNGGGASASVQIDEGQTAVTTVAATDPDGAGAITYSITGGAHAGLFVINGTTGALSFAAAPDYESPLGGSANLYSVTVTASDGELSSSQSVQVGVRNVNEGVTITSGAAQSVVENSAAVTTVAAQDLDGDSVSFAVSGGADAHLFAIDSASGALRFLAAPNFEAPADSDGDNVYEVTVSASDGTLVATRNLSVAVTNENEAIAFVSGGGGDQASVTIDENTGPVLDLLAVDPDGAAPSYGIAGGADAALFMLDPVTRALQFRDRPDFENRRDSDGDNVYEVVVGTSDGETTDYQTVSVTVANVYEGLAFGAPSVEFAVDENGGQVGVVSAVSGDGYALVYSITGGDDASLFSVDSATGALSFVEAPDFEAPGASGGGNVYRLTVTASDGIHGTSQAVTVVVGNVDEGVELRSYGGVETVALSVAENGAGAGQVEVRDLDGGEVTYSIAGGADSGLFQVDSATGALSFVSAPDFEAAADAGGDNVYEVAVAGSAGGSTATQSFAISVTNRNEGISIVSNGGGAGAAVALNEGERTVTTVVAHDPDGAPVSYSIAGGADSSRFAIDAATGLLTLIDAPDYELPVGAAGNVYEVVVAAGDGELVAYQSIEVTIDDVNEGVTITTGSALSVNEDSAFVTQVTAIDGDGDSIGYSIVGGADASHFWINPETGDLSMQTWLDYEAPVDSDGDNVYEITVRASDGSLSDDRQMSITVNDVYDDIEIVSYGGADSVSLTMQELSSFEVADLEASFSPFYGARFSIGGGADAALFTIDPWSGKLSFNYPFMPDFEAPGDSGGDNVYDVVVVATMATSTDTQAFAITITNRNEYLSIVSDGGWEPKLSMDEGNLVVTTVVAEDRDGDSAAYSILGGPDSALFAIDSVTGVLRFIAAPDYEQPGSAAGTNVYTVEVGASDGEFMARQLIRVTIGNVNERPVVTSGGGGDSLAVTASENGLAAARVTASDVDGNPLTYSITGGADASRFTIESWSGILRFVQAPNFEAPGDSGGNNVYDVVVTVTDGVLSDSQSVAVTVSNVDEAVAITSNGGGASASVAVAENATAVATVAASDPDGGAVTYAIAGGADAARFRIDPGTGALAFVSAPNFEAPADSGADNVYDVVVSASDGSFTDTQAIAVTVGNVNEGVSITSNGGGADASVAVAENGTAVTKVVAADLDGGAVTYSIAGGSDSARFTIDSATGVLAFVSAPNFEAPGDSGGNNVYDVLVSATDGSFTDTQAIAVTVANVNEAPVVTSNGGAAAGAASVAENSLAVTVVAATDPDGTALTYSIVGGSDSARFTINAQTGALQFVAAPDWELPGDSNQDNVYSVVVRSSDGQLVDDQALNVTVTNIRDGNNVTGTAAGDSISPTSLVVALRTSNEEDLVFGRDGHDTIQGMAGADEIYGEGGNDVLIGGDGADKLSGGLGKDQFTYNSVSESTGAARDLITDFSRAQGDKISLSGIDANSLLSTNQAFTFIGTSAFSNVAGQLRYETSAGVTTIFGDVNGDGVADLQIQLSGSIPLISSDFIL